MLNIVFTDICLALSWWVCSAWVLCFVVFFDLLFSALFVQWAFSFFRQFIGFSHG